MNHQKTTEMKDYLELLNDFNEYYSHNYNRREKNVFEITQREKSWALRYPNLKKYVANEYGNQMVHICTNK